MSGGIYGQVALRNRAVQRGTLIKLVGPQQQLCCVVLCAERKLVTVWLYFEGAHEWVVVDDLQVQI